MKKIEITLIIIASFLVFNFTMAQVPCNPNWTGYSFKINRSSYYNDNTPQEINAIQRSIDSIYFLYPQKMRDFIRDKQNYESIRKLIKYTYIENDKNSLENPPYFDDYFESDLFIFMDHYNIQFNKLDELLLEAQCIYKIKVDDVKYYYDSYYDSYYENDSNKYVVTSTIQKKFKGNIISTCSQEFSDIEYLKKDKNSILNQTKPITQFADSGSCFQMYYSSNWKRDSVRWTCGSSGNYKLENGKWFFPIMEKENGDPWMEVGKEYLVFTKHIKICETNEDVYLTMKPNLMASMACNIYPIDGNGIVQFSRELGFEKDVSESELYEEIFRKIKFIIK